MTTTSADVMYNPYDHETIINPHPLFRRMREEAPLFYSEEFDFYAVSRFEDIERTLLNRDMFISRKGVTLDILKSDWEIPKGTVIFEDPPEHDIHRSFCHGCSPPGECPPSRRASGACARLLLDPLIGARGFDFVGDLGMLVPMKVIGMLVGIPEADQESVRDHFYGRRFVRPGR